MTELETAQKRIAELEEELAEVSRQLAALTRYVFGKRSEQTPAPGAGQPELNLITEEEAPATPPPAPPDKPKGGSHKGRKIRSDLLPDHLPVEETVLIDVRAAADPDNWREIDREVTERLERVPGKLIILRLTRPVFVSLEQPFAAPVCAPVPVQFLPGSFLGPQLMVDLVLGKFLYHQPLYRQAKAMEWESGVKLSAATLSQTIARIAEALEPVVRCMTGELWQAPCVQFDLTPVRCLSREHSGGSFLGQMWVCAVPGADVIYKWDKSKAAIVADGIIPDWYQGIIQSDGGKEILCFLSGGKARDKPPPEIRRAACWAHVRRKFFEAAKAGCPIAARLLKIINVLYRIEDQARTKGLTPEERALLRERRSRRVIRGLRRRIDKTLHAERPRSPVGKACTYALGQWAALLVYLDHGFVEIDNNSVENAIRPCALGKKNWLFIGEVGAGQRSAILYSLLGSCLRRRINPRDYLTWLFAQLPTATNQTVHTLTPAAYAARTAPAAAPIPVPQAA